MPPKVAPGCSPGSAPFWSPKWRVIQTDPSFFGKPWNQPRMSAKSRSTQMYGQVVTSLPLSIALTTRKNSMYWLRAGSSSSLPPSVQLCQSAKIAAARPGSVGCGSRPGGRTARTASGSAQYSITMRSPT